MLIRAAVATLLAGVSAQPPKVLLTCPKGEADFRLYAGTLPTCAGSTACQNVDLGTMDARKGVAPMQAACEGKGPDGMRINCSAACAACVFKPCLTCSHGGPRKYKATADNSTCLPCSETVVNKVFTGEWVASKCDEVSFKANTLRKKCSVPSAKQWVKTRCIPGNPSKLGKDTVLQVCKPPAWDEYVTTPCFKGSVKECTAEFPVTSIPGGSIFQASLNKCTFAHNGKVQAPADTIMVKCTTPGITTAKYVQARCVPGDIDTVGKNAIVGTCTVPGPKQFVVAACVQGNATITGKNTVIGECTQTEDTGYLTGTYAVDACVAGNHLVVGKQAVIADCDDGACPDGNDECDDKCNVGFLTWFALFILVVLIIAGIVFAVLYVTENPLVMGGEKRRGVALQPVTEGADGNTRKFMKASTAEPGGHADVALEEVNFASEDDLAIFVEEPRPNGFAYRLANTKFVLTAGAEVQMSDRAAGEADRICRLKSDDGLLPEGLKGGLTGPVGRAIQLDIGESLERALVFKQVAALNGDKAAYSFSCTLGQGDEQEAHFLRHDDGGVLLLEVATKVDDVYASFYTKGSDDIAKIKSFQQPADDESQEADDTENPVAGEELSTE